MSNFIDILKDWERQVARPAVYDNLDLFFPEMQFRRMQAGLSKDRWVSRFKMNGTQPRSRNAEKTVVYRTDFKFREQGDWDNGVSVIDMIMSQNEFASVYDTYSWIASRLGLTMPRPDSDEISASVARRNRKEELLEKLQAYFVWNLNNNRGQKAVKTRNYLSEKRGFNKEQIKIAGFGFCPSWDTVERKFVEKDSYAKEELEEACGVRNDFGYTAVGKDNVLTVPCIYGGVLKGFLFRRIDSDGQPKYIANANLDRRSVFFNIPKAADEIIIVEGEIDSLTAISRGINNVVSIGGSEVAGERRHQIEDAFARGVKRITLCLDLDELKDHPSVANHAGRHSHIMKTVHTIKDICPSFEEIYVASFSAPSDPDEYIRTNGPDGFRALVNNAKPYWKYLFDYMIERK